MPRSPIRLLAPTTALCVAASLCVGLPPTQADEPTPEVTHASGTQTPQRVTGADTVVDATTPPGAARSYLARNKSTFAIDDPVSDLYVVDTVGSHGTETVRFEQRYEGVQVFGAHYLVHMRAEGESTEILGANGDFFTELDVDVEPTVSTEAAIEQAQNYVAEQLTHGKLGWAEAPEMQATNEGLVILPDGSGTLAHKVRVATYDAEAGTPVIKDVYVDAHTSWALFGLDAVQGAAPVEGTGVDLHGDEVPLQLTQTDDGRYQFLDQSKDSAAKIKTYDGRAYDFRQVIGVIPEGLEVYSGEASHFDGDATQSGVVDAHVNAGHVYDYFRSLGRDGLDGEGGDMVSVVGVHAGGQPFVNAVWDTEKMIYGVGDAEYLPMSAELDVVGHEMTHGVVQHTAGLLYQYQSGAINEAVADYFGNAVDVDVAGMSMDHPDAGLLGEHLCRTAAPRDCALRDLNDGRTVDSYVGATIEFDNGGVHYNSTIFSGALWDIREQLGGETADPLIYKALTEYMTPLDDFVDGREAILQAARDTNQGSQATGAVSAAFNKRGIRDGWSGKAGDATVLMAEIMAERTGPAAAGGWWVQSQSSPEGHAPYAIYSGRTDGKGEPIKLADPTPDDHPDNPPRYNVLPATDGHWAVWFAWGSNNAQVVRAPIDGSGEPEVVGHAVNPSQLSVDGDWIAWTSVIRGQPKQWYLNASQPGSQQPVDTTYHLGSASGSVQDGHLYYLLRWPDAAGWHLNVTVRDMVTGEETKLPEFLPEEDATGAGLYPPKLVGDEIVIGVDQQVGPASGIWRMNLDGSDRRQVIAEGDAAAPVLGEYDATGVAVTYENWPGITPPQVMQVDVDGGAPQRMSCSTGVQYRVAADEGTTAVWLDGSYGGTTLVARDRPRERC